MDKRSNSWDNNEIHSIVRYTLRRIITQEETACNKVYDTIIESITPKLESDICEYIKSRNNINNNTLNTFDKLCNHLGKRCFTTILIYLPKYISFPLLNTIKNELQAQYTNNKADMPISRLETVLLGDIITSICDMFTKLELLYLSYLNTRWHSQIMNFSFMNKIKSLKKFTLTEDGISLYPKYNSSQWHLQNVKIFEINVSEYTTSLNFLRVKLEPKSVFEH